MISEPESKPRNPILLPLILLIVSAVAFWVLPYQWTGKPVQVEFEGVKK